MKINKKRLCAFIFACFFCLPVVSFLVSYLFVVWSPPGAPILDQLGWFGALLRDAFWLMHMILTSFFIAPIRLLFPAYFEHSKLVGIVPYPQAFLLGGLFYLLASLGLAWGCGCFRSQESSNCY